MKLAEPGNVDNSCPEQDFRHLFYSSEQRANGTRIDLQRVMTFY